MGPPREISVKHKASSPTRTESPRQQQPPSCQHESSGRSSSQPTVRESLSSIEEYSSSLNESSAHCGVRRSHKMEDSSIEKGPPLTLTGSPRRAMRQDELSSLTSRSPSFDDASSTMEPTKPQDIFRSKKRKKCVGSPFKSTRKTNSAKAAATPAVAPIVVASANTPNRRAMVNKEDKTPLRDNRGSASSKAGVQASSPVKSAPRPKSAPRSLRATSPLASKAHGSNLQQKPKPVVESDSSSKTSTKAMSSPALSASSKAVREPSTHKESPKAKNARALTAVLRQQQTASTAQNAASPSQVPSSQPPPPPVVIQTPPPIAVHSASFDTCSIMDGMTKQAVQDVMEDYLLSENEVQDDDFSRQTDRYSVTEDSYFGDSFIVSTKEWTAKDANDVVVAVVKAKMRNERKSKSRRKEDESYFARDLDVTSLADAAVTDELMEVAATKEGGESSAKETDESQSIHNDEEDTGSFLDVASIDTKNVAKTAVVTTPCRHDSTLWWKDDDDSEGNGDDAGDEEKGNSPISNQDVSATAVNETNKTKGDKEPFPLRRTLIILFIILGVAAITGGIAAYLTSVGQGKKNQEEEAVPSLSPVATTYEPSVAEIVTIVPTTQPPSSTKAPTPWPTEQMPGLPVLPTNLPPTEMDFDSFRETIVFMSPETATALEDPSSPQSRALDWVVNNQNNPSPVHFGLSTLRYATNETGGWKNDQGWLEPFSDVCDWHGVSCAGGYPIEIVLSFNNLAGTLPSEVSLLTSLQVLSMAGSSQAGETRGSLVGRIPVSWGERLVNLVALELYDNQLTGPLPSSLGLLANLRALHLDGNNLTGSVPPGIGDMSSLATLNLQNNHFVGNVPTQIGQLDNLLHLALNGNSFSGSLPSQVGNLVSLNELDLQNNGFGQSLPRNVFTLTNLAWFNVAGNAFTGIIPSLVGLLSNLEGLFLQENNMDGTLPTQLSSMQGLRYLNVSHNDFDGVIPTSLSRLTSLVDLSLEGNDDLEGHICELSDLAYFTSVDCCLCCTVC